MVLASADLLRPPIPAAGAVALPDLPGPSQSSVQLSFAFQGAPPPLLPGSELEWLLRTVGITETAAHLAASQIRHLTASERKRRGSFDTPPTLIHEVLQSLLPMLRWPTDRPLRVLEPSAGFGGFALGLLEHAGTRGPVDLHLCESDPATALTCEHMVALVARQLTLPTLTTHCLVGDALLEDRIPPGSFDLVIGNPPFVASYARDSHGFADGLKARLRERYRFAQGRINTAVCFIELGLRALRPGGVLAFVLPSALFHMTTWAKLRRWLLEEHEILAVRYCGEWAFAADVPTGVLIVRKGSAHDPLPGMPRPEGLFISRDAPPLATSCIQETFLRLPQMILTPYVDRASRQFLTAMERNSIPLGELVEIRDGINLANSKEQLLSESPRTEWHRPVLRGSDIAPWQIRWGGSWVFYSPAEIAALKGDGGYAFLREPWLFSAPGKLVHRQTADRLIAAIDRDRFAVLNSCHISIPRPLLPDPERPGAALLTDPALEPLTDLTLLCALYNSRLLNCYYRLVFCEVEDTFPQVKTVNLRLLPIPRLPAGVREAIRSAALTVLQAPLPEQQQAAMDTIETLLAEHLGLPWPLPEPHLAAMAR